MTAGYGAVKVAFADGARKTVGVHRLVTAIKTGYMPPRSIEAMHSCDNRLCVNPDHLSWGTVADNAEDRSAKGRSARSLGEKNGRAVLSKDDVANIRASNQTQTELADHYGVSQSTISLVKSGQTWKPSHKPLSLVADQRAYVVV